MPELPEVETVVRGLREIVGRKVIFNKLFSPQVFKTKFYKLDNLIIEKVERYGKYIIIKFEKSAMMIHLGMSGQLYLEDGKYELPKYCHFTIQLDDGQQIRFVDHRHFGKVWHMAYQECLDYVHSKLGPEIWDIEPESYVLRFRQSKYANKMIKPVLLEQKLIAGVGNIYASEILWWSIIHPKTLVKDLTDNQLQNLYYITKKVLEEAIKNCGTTLRDYRDAKNQTGNNQHFLKAYKQVNCHNCGTPIHKETIETRMTYWCPTCQGE